MTDCDYDIALHLLPDQRQAGAVPHEDVHRSLARHAGAVIHRDGDPVRAGPQDAGGWASPAMPLRYVERQAVANAGVRVKSNDNVTEGKCPVK